MREIVSSPKTEMRTRTRVRLSVVRSSLMRNFFVLSGASRDLGVDGALAFADFCKLELHERPVGRLVDVVETAVDRRIEFAAHVGDRASAGGTRRTDRDEEATGIQGNRCQAGEHGQHAEERFG